MGLSHRHLIISNNRTERLFKSVTKIGNVKGQRSAIFQFEHQLLLLLLVPCRWYISKTNGRSGVVCLAFIRDYLIAFSPGNIFLKKLRRLKIRPLRPSACKIIVLASQHPSKRWKREQS